MELTAKVIQGDCLEVMRGLPDNSVDAVVTDPPYGLSQHSTEDVQACLLAWCNGKTYAPNGSGFMGKSWDAWVPGPEVWREVLRVLKPGGHCLVFAGTRSMDLMSMAVRLAGLELRDSIGYAHADGGNAPLLAWAFGSGFPKSHDVSKAIDREAGADDGFITAPATAAAQQWEGWGSALKPAWEPVILARKPLQGTIAQNVQAWGCGGLNVDGCRVGTNEPVRKNTAGGLGYASDNAITAGTGTTMQTAGRFPANLILSGEQEVVSCFPESVSRPNSYGATLEASISVPTVQNAPGNRKSGPNYQDSGSSAARFFKTCPDDDPDDAATRRLIYQGKATKADRDDGLEAGGNNHVTVKPTPLMRYLCRLITPPGGTVLDPFAGSGSTGRGAVLEGFSFIGIEREPEYVDIARHRIYAAAQKSPNVAVEDAAKFKPVNATPKTEAQLNLFG